MNSTEQLKTLCSNYIGRQVETPKGVMRVGNVIDLKLGTMKNGDRAPYIHLAGETGDMDLHPEKAKQLFTTGECGAYKILAELAGGEVHESMIEQMVIAASDTKLLTVNDQPAAVDVSDEKQEGVKTVEQQQPAKKLTKKAQTIQMYAEGHAAGLARKDIIARMKTELGMSDAGANTYYQNVHSGIWK